MNPSDLRQSMEGIRQGDIPGVQLRCRVEAPGGSPAELWPFWVEAERQIRWLCSRSRIEDGPPMVFWLESDDPREGLRREVAEVLESHPPRRLVLGFRELDAGWSASTRVTIELAELATGCGIMVFQEGFQQLPLSDGLTVWERSRVRWTGALARLARIAADDKAL